VLAVKGVEVCEVFRVSWFETDGSFAVAIACGKGNFENTVVPTPGLKNHEGLPIQLSPASGGELSTTLNTRKQITSCV
jgi:hypothetical protein